MLLNCSLLRTYERQRYIRKRNLADSTSWQRQTNKVHWLVCVQTGNCLVQGEKSSCCCAQDWQRQVKICIRLLGVRVLWEYWHRDGSTTPISFFDESTQGIVKGASFDVFKTPRTSSFRQRNKQMVPKIRLIFKPDLKRELVS